MSYRRVVVTGLGVVSSIGIGKDAFWDSLVAGKCGISDVRIFDTSAHLVHRGGEVKDFDPADFMPNRTVTETARASHFAIAAAKLALEDAGIELAKEADRRIAVLIGTTMGEGGMIEEIDRHWVGKGEDDVWALTIARYPSNAISMNVSSFFKLCGMSAVLPTACSGGNYAIGYGYDLIRNGSVDRALVGGADPFSRIGFTGFGRLFAMSADLCRPFDKNRKGMMVGEGAGILLLETLDAAKRRDAPIYAEIAGYGLSCDAHHMTAPQTEGVAKVMERALKHSGVRRDRVDFVCTHGTGTPANDKTECDAIKKVFGEAARDLSINSIKSMLGHTMGAASAIEAASCCLAIRHNIIPPTINYETSDPECDLDCVPNRAKERAVNVVLNNSLAFGGNNACVALKRYES